MNPIPHVFAMLLQCGDNPLAIRSMIEVNNLNTPNEVVFVSKAACNNSIIEVPTIKDYMGCTIEPICTPHEGDQQ